MGETIRQSDLRNNNAEIMRRVAAGESFTVTVHGQAVADLVPHQREQPKRRFVPIAEINAILGEGDPDPEGWKALMAESDDTIDDDDLENPWDRKKGR
jgi:prevent-host-death family protein